MKERRNNGIFFNLLSNTTREVFYHDWLSLSELGLLATASLMTVSNDTLSPIQSMQWRWLKSDFLKALKEQIEANTHLLLDEYFLGLVDDVNKESHVLQSRRSGRNGSGFNLGLHTDFENLHALFYTVLQHLPLPFQSLLDVDFIWLSLEFVELLVRQLVLVIQCAKTPIKLSSIQAYIDKKDLPGKTVTSQLRGIFSEQQTLENQKKLLKEIYENFPGARYHRNSSDQFYRAHFKIAAINRAKKLAVEAIEKDWKLDTNKQSCAREYVRTPLFIGRLFSIETNVDEKRILDKLRILIDENAEKNLSIEEEKSCLTSEEQRRLEEIKNRFSIIPTELPSFNVAYCNENEDVGEDNEGFRNCMRDSYFYSAFKKDINGYVGAVVTRCEQFQVVGRRPDPVCVKIDFNELMSIIRFLVFDLGADLYSLRTLLLKLAISAGYAHILESSDDQTEQAVHEANECVEVFLDAGAKINWPSSGRSLQALSYLLYFASKSSSSEYAMHFLMDVTKKLLAAGVSVDFSVDRLSNRWEVRPLHCAARFGLTDFVKLLLDAGAKVDVLSSCDEETVEMSERETPLYFAAKYGHIEIVELLLAKGARVDNQIISATSNQEILPLLQEELYRPRSATFLSYFFGSGGGAGAEEQARLTNAALNINARPPS